MQKILFLFSFLLLGTAQAALVDNGTYTTDSSAGLDWLDLSATTGLSMEAALAANSDWRYATNSEVEGLHAQLFDGYYDTYTGWSCSCNGAYADQSADVTNFRNLFGITRNYQFYPSYQLFTLGFYEDEAGIIREIGAVDVIAPTAQTSVYGLDFTQVRDTTTAVVGRGTYLVRSTVVPIPAAVWLFGSALAGLGWMRRKQTA